MKAPLNDTLLVQGDNCERLKSLKDAGVGNEREMWGQKMEEGKREGERDDYFPAKREWKGAGDRLLNGRLAAFHHKGTMFVRWAEMEHAVHAAYSPRWVANQSNIP